MYTVTILFRIALSIITGIIAGFSAIYTFNRIPPKWLCDYDQEPSHEMWGERIGKKPWAVVFSLVFIAALLKLTEQGLLYAIPGLFCLWILLLIGVADKKYMIIPDQFIIALAVVSLGFIPFHDSFLSQLLGALIGGGSILMIGIIGKLLFRKETMGFGDVKLFGVIGLICGIEGIIIILMLTVFLSAIFFGFAVILGRIKMGEEQPLGPFISAGTAAYVLFQNELLHLAGLYLSLF